MDSDPLQYIQKLDLDYLAHRLIKKDDWDLEEAQEAVRKYKNFLTLHSLYPSLHLVPTSQIDEAWHAHILHTKNYMKDCEAMFGEYLHHRPSEGTQEGNEQLGEGYLNTARMYTKTFQESYNYTFDISEWQH